jgi:phosphoglycolate phosphatase-like HAD superfamily hydrolase
VRAPLVVGFDLDMTLIDTRPGFAACLVALGEETGVDFDVEGMVERLGPPLDMMLAPYFPSADQAHLDRLVGRFRELYPEIVVPQTEAFPGAHDALAVVREHGGSTLMITGKYGPNARLHADALDFDVDRIIGSVWGPGKGPVLVEHGASVYVGDHVHDVEGALAAGIHSVSVLTGGCVEEELVAAGTHTVLADLTGFPDWFEEHLVLGAGRSELTSR